DSRSICSPGEPLFGAAERYCRPPGGRNCQLRFDPGTRRGRRSARWRASLPAGVGQVVQVDGLAVAVDVGGDQSEAVEARADAAVLRRQVQLRPRAVEGKGEPPAARGRVFETPVVRLAIRQQAWGRRLEARRRSGTLAVRA